LAIKRTTFVVEGRVADQGRDIDVSHSVEQQAQVFCRQAVQGRRSGEANPTYPQGFLRHDEHALLCVLPHVVVHVLGGDLDLGTVRVKLHLLSALQKKEKHSKKFEDQVCVLLLRVLHQVTQGLVHHRVHERQVMPADPTVEDTLEDMAVQKQRANLILQQAQANYP
ncbi:hypothetical protein EGW08_019192, partial [Elysia chlorotica]